MVLPVYPNVNMYSSRHVHLSIDYMSDLLENIVNNVDVHYLKIVDVKVLR
jgi:hypothetical protein